MWVLEETVYELKRILGGHSVVSGEPNCMFIHLKSNSGDWNLTELYHPCHSQIGLCQLSWLSIGQVK